MARVETVAVPKLTSHDFNDHNKSKLAVKKIIPNNKTISANNRGSCHHESPIIPFREDTNQGRCVAGVQKPKDLC